jgi:hypothetical protein
VALAHAATRRPEETRPTGAQAVQTKPVHVGASVALLAAVTVDGETWIETTSYRDENRTVWIIRHDGAIVRAGEVSEDPSGSKAFEEATTWVVIADRPFDWKHCQVAR